MFFITKEPREDTYRELIDKAALNCSTFVLVIRHQLEMNKLCEGVISELSPDLIEVKEQDNWPGTKLINHMAKVYYFKVNSHSKAVLKRYAKGLYDWVQPNLPEDLSFLKSNGEAWLINIAHEKESYIDCINLNEFEGVKDLLVEEVSHGIDR